MTPPPPVTPKVTDLTQEIRSPDCVQSVAFLPENRIMLALSRTNHLPPTASGNGHAERPVLAVYNLHHEPSSWRRQVRRVPVAIFALEFGRDIIPINMQLHFRLNVHSYSPGVAVPFFIAQTEQLVALQMSGHLIVPVGGNPRRATERLPPITLCHILLIPITKLLSHVPATDDLQPRYIPWDDWGVAGTHRVPEPHFSQLFRGALSGSRFIPRPESRDLISIWDFNRARVAKLKLRDTEFVPCVHEEVALPEGIMGRVTAAISDDVIVLREASVMVLSLSVPSTHPRSSHRTASFPVLFLR
jgi:hypothetical protein